MPWITPATWFEAGSMTCTLSPAELVWITRALLAASARRGEASISDTVLLMFIFHLVPKPLRSATRDLLATPKTSRRCAWDRLRLPMPADAASADF